MFTEKQRFLVFALTMIVSTWIGSAAAVAVTPDLSDSTALEAFLDGVVTAQLRERHIPGATVAVG